MDWPLLARPTVRVAAMFPLDARNFDHQYRGPFHALHLHEYAGTIRIGDANYTLEPGTLTLSPATIDSSYDLPRPGVHWCVHFNPQPAKVHGPTVAVPLVRPLGDRQAEAVARFAQVARLHGLSVDDPPLAAAASVAMQDLLVWAGLLDRVPTGTARPRGVVTDLLFEFIDRHLGRPINAGELAAEAGLSPNYLARLFRERTGLTLPRYVLMRRIALARLLLGGSNLPIKQIARRVGLPDAQHFNKQFRSVAGVSPSAFRATGDKRPVVARRNSVISRQ